MAKKVSIEKYLTKQDKMMLDFAMTAKTRAKALADYCRKTKSYPFKGVFGKTFE